MVGGTVATSRLTPRWPAPGSACQEKRQIRPGGPEACRCHGDSNILPKDGDLMKQEAGDVG